MKSLEQLHQPEDTPAVYVVHGIGKQNRGETAAQLYGNFEDAMEAIVEWQKNQSDVVPRRLEHLPYTWEGYWADYDNPENTLSPLWDKYTDEEKDFCRELWGHRVISAGATYRWSVRQVFRLWFNPFRLLKVTKWRFLLAWPLYGLMTLFTLPLLTVVYLRKSQVMRDYLNDVRLYVDPRGKIEQEIVASVDKSIRFDIMRLIGLAPDFRPLSPDNQMSVLGRKRRFKRVIWVAHSLGTVISYNVLAKLVEEAVILEKEGDAEQQKGVALFRECLARFVTLGSPLDKIAYLFRGRLRPWPRVKESTADNPHEEEHFVNRDEFFNQADDFKGWLVGEHKEWWINFYHVLDPVSGSLDSQHICGDKPPANFHARSCLIPGVAHVAYWKDLATLRFILSRAYGRTELRDKPISDWPSWLLTLLAAGAYLVWAVLMAVGIVVMVAWGWQFVQSTWGEINEMVSGLLSIIRS